MELEAVVEQLRALSQQEIYGSVLVLVRRQLLTLSLSHALVLASGNGPAFVMCT